MPVRLFVGNLPYEASEAELREHFSAVGPLSSVFLPVDRETGRPRGFAFVEFADTADGQRGDPAAEQPAVQGATAVGERGARPREPARAVRRRPGGGPPRHGPARRGRWAVPVAVRSAGRSG